MNYTEFISAAINLKTYLNKEKLWGLFKYFDVNNLGYITAADIKEIVAREGRKMLDEDVNSIFERINSKKEGKVDFEDF